MSERTKTILILLFLALLVAGGVAEIFSDPMGEFLAHEPETTP